LYCQIQNCILILYFFQINSHKVLSDEEKINLQQYITRIYGSLTSFNILFADKDDYFVGAKS